MRKLMFMAVLALAFVACENENENKIPDWFTPTGEKVEIGIGDQTRVSLDYDGKQDNLRWVAGDILGIYCAEAAATTAQGYTTCANIPATIKADALSEDRKSTTVYPEIEYNDVEQHTFYIYYPWSNSGNTSANEPIISGLQLPTTQYGDIAQSTITWTSKTVSKPYGRINDVKLVTPFAYVRFYFASPDALEENDPKQVSSVMMEAVTGTKSSNGAVTVTGSDNSAVFCGTYNVDLRKAPTSGVEGAEYPEEGAVTFTTTNNVITVNQSADITVGSYDKSKGVLMHINSSDAFEGEGKYFRITVMFSDGTYAVTYKEAKNFEANHIYNYGFNIKKFQKETETEIYVEPWHLITCEVAFD